MRFGHFCLPTYTPEVDGEIGDYMHRWLDLLVESEELGFDELWCNEHHFHSYGGIIPSTPMLLSALAQRTRRARLGTSIVVLPLHNPIEVAEQFAMVDLMSGGRVQLGVGRGFVTRDYEVFGIPVEEGQDRLTEGLDVILKAWQGGPMSHHGTYHHFENVDVWPKPEQSPRPPIFVACTSNPKSFEWVGQQGFNLLTVAYGPGFQDVSALNDIYRSAWNAAGHPANGWAINTHYQVVVAETSAEAREICVPALIRYRQAVISSRRLLAPEEPPDYERLLATSRIISGTPDECAQQLRAAQQQVGFTCADLMFYWAGIPYETARRSLHLFASEVMPKLREPVAA
ncbi:MAG TPA: LLM class flavin-dependent oxidoreductase [Chloroflexota bacterium]|nr:LLM class flavin-dependent oxidoreductase [Chloroflexota bacterium]